MWRIGIRRLICLLTIIARLLWGTTNCALSNNVYIFHFIFSLDLDLLHLLLVLFMRYYRSSAPENYDNIYIYTSFFKSWFFLFLHNRYIKRSFFFMDIVSTIPLLQLAAGQSHVRGEVFAFLNLFRLWRLRNIGELFSRYIYRSEIKTKAKVTSENHHSHVPCTKFSKCSAIYL